MSVRLVGITKPVVEEAGTSPATLLAFCARVSSTANQQNHETGPKLLKSLINRQEWSPLEMGGATFEIETTRDIARQMLRHRSFSFQEFSQRYSTVVEFSEPREARLQDLKDRQNSIEGGVPKKFADWWRGVQRTVMEDSRREYNKALSYGIAKEVARSILPEGLTMSRLYMAGSFRSWFHYCSQRGERKTQKEHRLIAMEVCDILADHLPDLFGELSHTIRAAG